MTPTRDQQPPHNAEAERSVLGAVLLAPIALDRVSGVLGTIDFFRDCHRVVYAVMLEMAAEDQRIDLVTVKDELTRRGKLDEAGGAAYVASLVDGIPDIANVEDYAVIVHEMAARRRLIAVGHQVMQDGYDGLDSAGEVAARSAMRLSEFAVTEDKGPQPIDAVMKRALTALEARVASGNYITGISTSIDTLDGYTLGLQRGALSLLLARTKVGKTVLADEIALQAARRGERVLFVELDMPEGMHAARLLVAASGVDSFAVRTGTGLSKSDWSKLGTAAAMAHGLGGRLTLDWNTRDIGKIVALIRKHARGGGLDLVIVDHVGHVQGGTGERYAQIGDVSSRLIGAAVENNAAALMLMQLKREAEVRVPTLADAYESGSPEQNARLAVLLDRPFRRDEQNAAGLPIPACQLNVQVAKNEGEESPWFSAHIDLQLQRVTTWPERRCSAKGCPYEVPTIREERMFR